MPASGSKGRLLSTLRMRTRVMEGGRIEVCWPTLPAGAAVEVEVHLEEALETERAEPLTPPPAPPAQVQAAPVQGEGTPEAADLDWWLDALPVTRRTPPGTREDWELEQRAS